MKLLKCALFSLVCVFVLSSVLFASDKIKIATSTSTLASLAREIAGPEADIYYVASPSREIHFYAPTPKDVLKVKKADVYIHGGLDLELWRDPLLNAVGEEKFMGEDGAAIDVSKNVPLLEVPVTLSRSEGDVHVFGNPHYAIDPLNAKIMARNIAEGLARNFPERKEAFFKNAEAFSRKIDEKMIQWEALIAPYKGTRIVTYHRCWPYFAERFGLEVVSQVEPKPGIPPTAKHMAFLKRLIKEKNIQLIIAEPYNEDRTTRSLAQEGGIPLVILGQDVEEKKGKNDYFSLIDHNLGRVVEALSSQKSKEQKNG